MPVPVRVREWDVDERRLPGAARAKVAALHAGEPPGRPGPVSLLQLQRVLGNRAVNHALDAGALTEHRGVTPPGPGRPTSTAPQGRDAAKFLSPVGGNPKIDRPNAAVAAEIEAEERAEMEEEEAEIQEAVTTGVAKAKEARARDLEQRKAKGTANENRRGGMKLSRLGFNIVKPILGLPDTAVKRMEPAGPNASGAIGNSYGICDTEDITDADIRIKAVRKGGEWHAQLDKVAGRYSLITQMPQGIEEITGPGGAGPGATTVANSKKQIRSLLATEGDGYYLEKAVQAHEEVHEDRVLPALRAMTPDWQDEFWDLSVADAGKGNPSTATAFATEGEAIAAIKATPAYAQKVAAMRDEWDNEYVDRITGDHGGKTQRAEVRASTPMILKINAFRISRGKKPLRWKETWQPY